MLLKFLTLDSIYSFYIYISDIMILVNLDLIPFYLLFIKVDLTNKQSLIVSSNYTLVVSKNEYVFTIFRSTNK